MQIPKHFYAMCKASNRLFAFGFCFPPYKSFEAQQNTTWRTLYIFIFALLFSMNECLNKYSIIVHMVKNKNAWSEIIQHYAHYIHIYVILINKTLFLYLNKLTIKNSYTWT